MDTACGTLSIGRTAPKAALLTVFRTWTTSPGSQLSASAIDESSDSGSRNSLSSCITPWGKVGGRWPRRISSSRFLALFPSE